MAAPYAGADAFPTTILSPDDGDSRQASFQNIPDQGLADRTVWLQNRTALKSDTFLASGSWTCPPLVFFARIVGVGAGSGGGGGVIGGTIVGNGTLSGGGGGGAPLNVIDVPVVPGTIYTVTIPAGGAGGAASASGTGNPGADGADSTFGGSLARCSGASGGSGGINYVAANNGTHCHGGMPTKSTPSTGNCGFVVTSLFTSPSTPLVPPIPGQGGGSSSSANNSCFGGTSANDFAGGASGLRGASITYPPGTAGGGGGGGGAGVGAAGGTGGAGTNTGTGGNGSAGSSAAANTGGGGGGGGSGGSASATAGTGTAGGNGGSGRITVYYAGVQAVVA